MSQRLFADHQHLFSLRTAAPVISFSMILLAAARVANQVIEAVGLALQNDWGRFVLSTLPKILGGLGSIALVAGALVVLRPNRNVDSTPTDVWLRRIALASTLIVMVVLCSWVISLFDPLVLVPLFRYRTYVWLSSTVLCIVSLGLMLRRMAKTAGRSRLASATEWLGLVLILAFGVEPVWRAFVTSPLAPSGLHWHNYNPAAKVVQAALLVATAAIIWQYRSLAMTQQSCCPCCAYPLNPQRPGCPECGWHRG